MDSATEDIYLQKLEEFVYDEEKIVTPRWLSYNLNINIKDSTHLLQKYVLDIKNAKRKDLTLTYLLCGIAANDRLHITIVKENEIEEKKSLFSKIVDQQIYSIQTCKAQDLGILSHIDHFDMHDPKDKPVRGSIISRQCIQRVFKAKKSSPKVQSVDKPMVQSKASIFTKIPAKSNLKNEQPESAKTLKESTNSAKTKTNHPKESPKTKANQSNGIAGFFTKSAAQVHAKPSSEITAIKPEKLESVPERNSTQNNTNTLIDSESDDEPVVQSQVPKSKVNHKLKNATKRQKKTNDKVPSAKRRRRIIEQESDSDDMFGEEQKEEAIMEDVMSNSEDETPKAKPKPPLAPKNNKRKLVDRTYTDEEGYIITSKEWIEESPSEDELIPDKSKENPKEKSTEETKPVVTSEVKPKSDAKRFKKSTSTDLLDANNKDGKMLNEKLDMNTKDNKMLNGKAKGGKKGKKPLAANQPTLMNFFKRA